MLTTITTFLKYNNNQNITFIFLNAFNLQDTLMIVSLTIYVDISSLKCFLIIQ